MPIKYSLKFSSISFQNLLLCLPSNYTYCVWRKCYRRFLYITGTVRSNISTFLT
jgi:hypothetical protein